MLSEIDLISHAMKLRHGHVECDGENLAEETLRIHSAQWRCPHLSVQMDLLEVRGCPGQLMSHSDTSSPAGSPGRRKTQASHPSSGSSAGSELHNGHGGQRREPERSKSAELRDQIFDAYAAEARRCDLIATLCRYSRASAILMN